MAATGHFTRFLYIFIFLFSPIPDTQTLSRLSDLKVLELQDLPEILKDSCVLAVDAESLPAHHRVQQLLHAFSNEPSVKIIKVTDLHKAKVKDNVYIPENHRKEADRAERLPMQDVVFFPRREVDRKCLLSNTSEFQPVGEQVSPSLTVKDLLSFLNSRCGSFRELNGSLNSLGRRRESILNNLFKVPALTDQQSSDPKIQISCHCEEIDLPSKEEFIHKYLYRSKPVVIKGAANDWPAIRKWTNEFLVENFGNNNVHIKLAPNGDFEGCDKASTFDDFHTFKIPPTVKDQLPYDDLVVVRPATMDINFRSFMDLLDVSKTEKKYRNVSAYLEYSSIPQHMPALEKDIKELPFAAALLNRKHLNLWLSNGGTVGRLHFDPFDNVLAQLIGTKEFILYEPFDNTKLYEGHIQEALLGFNKGSGKFWNQKLLDSTSMVMSPIDITDPDYERFPKFKEAFAMNCTVSEGDVLYMPAFWWHEVRSHPGLKTKKNMAVNFWYEPFFKKEFPCATCKMDLNPTYHHLLENS